MCGMSNIKSNSDQSTSCAQNLPKQVNWTIEDFATNLNNWQVFLQNKIFSFILFILINFFLQKRVYYFNQESHSAGVPTLDIQYESIQTDENNVLEVIFILLSFLFFQKKKILISFTLLENFKIFKLSNSKISF